MALDNISNAIISLLVGAILWLIRVVLTNQRKVALLEQELKLREAAREKDREDINELKNDVKLLNQNILTLVQRKNK